MHKANKNRIEMQEYKKMIKSPLNIEDTIDRKNDNLQPSDFVKDSFDNISYNGEVLQPSKFKELIYNFQNNMLATIVSGVVIAIVSGLIGWVLFTVHTHDKTIDGLRIKIEYIEKIADLKVNEKNDITYDLHKQISELKQEINNSTFKAIGELENKIIEIEDKIKKIE